MFGFDQLCDPDLKQEVAAHIVASGDGGTRRQKLRAWLCGRKVKRGIQDRYITGSNTFGIQYITLTA